MVKIIKFTNAIVYWANEPLIIPDRTVRFTNNIDVLPKDTLLEFNCEEQVLSSVSHDRVQLEEKVKQFLCQ